MTSMVSRITLFIFFLLPSISICQEICDNSIDDDNDGLIDLNDSDCQCLDVFDNTLYLANGDYASSPMCCVENNFAKDICLDNWIPVNGSPEYIDPDCYPDLAAEEESIGIPIDNEFIGLKYNDFSSFEFKETYGICTNAPLLKGLNYRLEFDIRFTPKEEHNAGVGSPHLMFFGLKTCDELVFTDATLGDVCELNFDLYPLDSLNFDEIPYTEWKTIKKTFMAPEDINAIIVAYACDPNIFSIKRFLFIDNISISLLLNQAFDFDLTVEAIGSLCDDDLSLSAVDRNGFDYQWYKEGIAIPGENTNELSIVEDSQSNGIYQLLLENSDGCVLTEQVEVLVDERSIDTTICLGSSLNISTGSFESAGIYTEKISSEFGCETRIYDLEFDRVIMGDTIVDSFQKGGIYSFAGEEFEETGIYTIQLKTSDGCDSLVTLQLSEIDFEIRIPNIFCPSIPGDDKFTVYIDAASVQVVNQFSIYDRWGNLVFNQTGMIPNQPELGWDGRMNNKLATPGVYTVFIQATFNDGESTELWSDINLFY